jgi:FixJ family two-component response regulator
MNRPIIAFAGRQALRERLAPGVEELGFALAAYAKRTGFVARLAGDQTALIVVDGAMPDWRWWVAAPKVSPATRRIPVVLVADDPAQVAAGLRAGADFAIAPGRLESDLRDLLKRHARVQSEGDVRRIEAGCAEPLPPQAREAVDLFNRGEYYRQHDLFEVLWMEEERPIRDLYRAILQVGIAYYQVKRGNLRGAHKMALRSLQWLNILPDVCQGVDIKDLRENTARLLDWLESASSGGDQPGAEPFEFPPVRLVD